MKHLLSFDEAQREIGISRQALVSAIDRGDLTKVELEGIRGATRRYVTAKSVMAWINKLNRDEEWEDEEQGESIDPRLPFDALLGFHMAKLQDRLEKSISTSISSRQERDRRTRLRHTVSSRIGDSFDPHGYYVYLLWGDDEETPLYIGQSRNILGRLGSHMQNSEKRYAVRSVQLIKCSGHATMVRTESALIREYKPPMNTVGTR